MINASVSYDQKTDTFNVAIADLSKGINRSGPVKITGATIENSRSRTLCVVENDVGGLAQFNTPIEWWACINGSSQANRNLWPDKFDMNKACADASCNTLKDIPPKAGVSQLGAVGAFTVKWLQQ